MATSGSLNSVKITAKLDENTKVTRYLTFSWKVATTSTGKTTIEWEIYGYGGNNAKSTFSISLDGTVIYSANNESISYNSTTPLKSGTKEYQHDSSGAARVNVEITVTKIWNVISSNTQANSWSLDPNYPYTTCYWTNQAWVKIDKIIAKPGDTITISWSGAQSGTANSIAGFEVYYSLNGGSSWAQVSKSISKTSTSTTMTVPSNRGSTISAKVVIKNTEDFTNPSKTGGSCKINSLPSAPTNLTTSKSIVPSNTSKVQFTMTKGKDNDGQNYSIKYSIGQTGIQYDYTVGTDLSLGSSAQTTYCFWTWDGLETSADCASYTITKNTKPTVSIGVKGDYIYTITASPSNGYSNNTYRYGYTYGGDNLITTSSSTSCNVGDIRHYLSNQLVGLEQGTTYKFKYWVQRNDGIEDSDRVYSNEISFTTPTLTLDPGNGPEGYFGANIKVQVNVNSNYYPTGLRSFASIKRGEQLKSISFKNDENSSWSFNIKIPSLTRVYGFDFSNVIINSSNPFKPYSQPVIITTMASRDMTYGFSGTVPDIKCGNSSIAGIENGADTWEYAFAPGVIWEEIIDGGANDSTTTFTKVLEITNDFGEKFTHNASFSFDFREAPIIDNFSVCKNASFIKEDTELVLIGTVKYYNKIVNINIKDNTAIQTRYSVEENWDSYLGNPWTENDNGGWENTGYHICNLSEVDKETQPVVTKFYKTKFTINATSAGQSSSVSTENEIPVLRHTPPRIRFTELEYLDSGSQKSLSGFYVIDDLGYDLKDDMGDVIPAAGRIQEIYMDGPDKDENNDNIKYTIWDSRWSQEPEPELNVPTRFKIDYPNFTENFRSLYPICKNNLEDSEKITEDFEYLVVYNILPTVAYRQNHLGINVKEPSAGDGLTKPVLTISAYNEENAEAEKARRYVYLTSAKNTASIDLVTGKQTGFVIDCGGW